MDSRLLCKIRIAWGWSGLLPYIRIWTPACCARSGLHGDGLDCFRIFGFVVMRRKRIEPSWKSARFPLVGLAARLRSRRIYQDLKALGLTDSPCRPFLTQFPVGFLLN